MKAALLATLSIAMICTGCDVNFNIGGTGLKGSGVSMTEDRDVSGFQKLDISGVGTFNITYGAEESLKITGDDNIVPLIEAKVENGKLRIKPTQSISPKTNLVFEIGTSELSFVDASGAVNVVVNDVAVDQLEFDMSGASSLKGNGTVTDLVIDSSGASSVKLGDLECENATISLSGAGKATLHASKSLDAEISGAGSVTCHGNPPEVKKDVSGVGKVKVVE